ncbi:PAS domain S-box protein (plasmid) [Halorarum halophilum]|uniref:histidine kinase n=1 Tax=Halorarum halophilum TaxID=2743090 RepID=A0A7D5KGN6_9EURY|nr:PAS domain S-box protein [Halobaculum halophilum]QLG29957.1 PAS domain S-box protein [Halobaculum halophilum]
MVETIKVLHVDDDPDVTELAAEFLERGNDRFDMVTETNAGDGLDRLTEDEIDCIVSDYQMPGMDGREFLAAVREAHPDLPFILFTGQGSEEIASDALSLGATDYLQKALGPEQYELLANRITNAVEHDRARQWASSLERVRTIVRDVNQALVRASSRQEIETRTCEIISEPDPVQFVVFSEVDPDTTRVEPRTWAGVDGGETFLDAVDITIGKHTNGLQTPHERAVHDREVAASLDIQEDPAFDPWREAVNASGFHALAVVPIEYEADLYGLVALYGSRPQPVDNARDLLEELGGDIAHAFYAIDTQRKLEKSEARYRNLAETASDAILRIDDTSTITYANPATERLFGYSQSELRDTALTELMPERLSDQHNEGIERYLRTGERQLDWSGVNLPGQHKDGTEIPLAITFGEFKEGDQQFFTGFIRDVTEREEQRAELQHQIKYLDEFAGTVAHDLRNPLNVVAGRLELAKAECDIKHLDVAVATLEQMEDLIEDLFTFAQQGQTVHKVEPVALADVVDTARRVVECEAVTVKAGPDLGTIVGSRSSVSALVENLFRNAVEHGGPNVTIRVSMLEEGIAVEDDGPGISEDKRADVFEPGYTTKDEGTGFGLNIVKKVVDAHGWDITVTGGADGGARFEITGADIDP